MHRKITGKILVLIVGVVALGATAATHATDRIEEQPAASASGSMRLSLIVPARMRVNGLHDMVGGRIPAQGIKSQSVCVFRSNADSFAVTAFGRNTGNGFVLQGEQGSLGYQVSFAGQPLQPGRRAHVANGASDNGSHCIGGGNVRLEITTPRGKGAGSGGKETLSDVLTIVFETT
ncbi:MAG: hypothetical protein ACOY33_13565 [Pseudomonadota bacterium]